MQQICTHISLEKLAWPPVNFGLRPGLLQIRYILKVKRIEVVDVLVGVHIRGVFLEPNKPLGLNTS